MKYLILILALTSGLQAATIWSFGAPGITSLDFFKSPSTDATDPAHWDQISPSVAITRLGNPRPGGIFNPVTETFYNRASSPAGTEWAFRDRNGNPSDPSSIIASNYTNLIFLPFEQAHGGANQNQDGTLRNIIEREAVLHIIAEDIYLDIIFTSWSNRSTNSGAFGYTRAQSDAIPEPSTALLLTLAPLLMRRKPRQ